MPINRVNKIFTDNPVLATTKENLISSILFCFILNPTIDLCTASHDFFKTVAII